MSGTYRILFVRQKITLIGSTCIFSIYLGNCLLKDTQEQSSLEHYIPHLHKSLY